ncbi:unnamed protein product [Anisakis simplex]|uniref:Protein-tyrosine phosphatase n=1 Tax=Anisakis simplex TaxID=6269 RepID=A0A0M3KA98_ANISI|nr:unnamed protein product [Anisakis simplex]
MSRYAVGINIPRSTKMAQITIENENTSQNRTEVMSINSSVELKDALVDDTWFWQGETHSTKPTGEKWLKKWKAQGSEHTGGDGYAKPPFYVRWFQSWQERKLLKRLVRFLFDGIQILFVCDPQNDNSLRTITRVLIAESKNATRVILHPTESGMDSGSEAINRTQQLTSHNVFFNDDDVPTPLKAHTAYGTSDFIHASYVRGGPLLNTFICTQAPMMSTINDFWQMVWQERSNYIIMLCGAFDPSRMGPLDSTMLSVCPYYWPRMEGEERLYGDFMVRNERVDGAMDPLFNVTYLSVWRADDTTRRNVHLLQHWQYDWTDFSDSHWPLRVLRRARLSPTPTIVQCMDGCGRSGTLVCIEALLMHVLRGSARYDKLILTTALFVRLQRRHSIATPLQYLFIYRTLLYWMQPYITSISQRFYLGLTYPQWGFVGKYNKLVAKHAAGSHYYFA